MWNRHRESKNTKLNEIGSGTELLYTFLSLKVLRHAEREGHTIFLRWLLLHRQLSTQPTRGARSAQSRLASPSSESQPFSSEAGTQLTAFSQISAHASGARRHPNTLVSIPIWDFYSDISEWHIFSACAWTPALMLHLTNPCAKRKVLSLTKPKGKIYKTKSLCHYITVWYMINSIEKPVGIELTSNGFFVNHHTTWNILVTIQYNITSVTCFIKMISVCVCVCVFI